MIYEKIKNRNFQLCPVQSCFNQKNTFSVKSSRCTRQVVTGFDGEPKSKLMADYYIENGFYVFTEQYHLKRGHCCKSGCRHCPYGFNKKIKNKKTAQKPNQKSSSSDKKNS